MKIVGNTVGTSLPKSNLMQTDPKKGDFVKGKDEFRKRAGVNIPGGANAGQMIVVKEVDESGNPTEWEAVDVIDDAHITHLIDAKMELIEEALAAI